MKRDPIPFRNALAPSVPSLAGGSPSAMNVISLGNGSLVRRPGIQVYAGAPSTAITGDAILNVHEALNGALYAVVDGSPLRHAYRVTPTGSTQVASKDWSDGIPGTKRPVLAETEMIIAIACGDQMRAILLPTDEQIFLSPQAPKASHVVANHLRLLANDVEVDRSAVRYSDVAIGDTWPLWGGLSGHTVWTYGGIGTSGYFTNNSRPDPVVAIYDTLGEIWVFGSTTTEVRAPNVEDVGGYGIEVWSPVGNLETGCCAPYSPIRHRELFFWLDHRRRFVVGDGSSVKDIGNLEIQKELDGLSTVDDCWGFVFQEANVVCLVWVFPTDGVAYCYQEGAGWCRWAGWDKNWTPLMVSAHHQRFSGAENIVGTLDGRVAKMTLNAQDDLGGTIRAYVETGFQNHGTPSRKHCDSVDFQLKRGAQNSSGPQAFFGWRDQEGPWQCRIPINLGEGGNTYPVVSFYSLGEYRTRDWFFEFSGAERLELLGATETYTED